MIVVVASLSYAISGLHLPDWTELRNSEAVLLSLFSLLFVHLAFIFGVCLRAFWEASFQIGIRREGRRYDSNIPLHIYAPEAGPSLISLQIAYGINNSPRD